MTTKEKITLEERYKDWNKEKFENLKVGQYVAYKTKPMRYQTGEFKDGALRAGGYITYFENSPKKKFMGMKSANGAMWSVNDINVEYYLVKPN